MKTIKLLTILMLLSILLTSCGKRRERNNNQTSGVDINTFSVEHVYLMCSRASIERRCLNVASDRLIPIRFFYHRSCYMDYRRCLLSNGVNI